MVSRLRPSGGCRGQPSGADVSHASLAAAIVADMLAATGREKTPIARSAAPKIWVAAAERVQRAGGPGRKLKNLATTLAEKPSKFCAATVAVRLIRRFGAVHAPVRVTWTLSKPWWIMSAQVPRRIVVIPASIANCLRPPDSSASANTQRAGTTRPIFVVGRCGCTRTPAFSAETDAKDASANQSCIGWLRQAAGRRSKPAEGCLPAIAQGLKGARAPRGRTPADDGACEAESFP